MNSFFKNRASGSFRTTGANRGDNISEKLSHITAFQKGSIIKNNFQFMKDKNKLEHMKVKRALFLIEMQQLQVTLNNSLKRHHL
jgi:hypothetical protein